MANNFYLIMYKGKGNIIDKAIRFFTKSKYSHCELAYQMPDGRYSCYSSSPRDNGVRNKIMNLNPENWDFIPVKIELATVVNFYNATRNMKYDLLGAMGIVLPFLHQDKNRYFCSEWCAQCLGLQNASKFSPKNLAQWAIAQEELRKAKEKING